MNQASRLAPRSPAVAELQAVIRTYPRCRFPSSETSRCIDAVVFLPRLAPELCFAAPPLEASSASSDRTTPALTSRRLVLPSPAPPWVASRARPSLASPSGLPSRPAAPSTWAEPMCWRRLRCIQLSESPDTLTWRWTESGYYTAKSCYLALFHGFVGDDHWRITWKTWAPLRFKIFTWLAFQDRYWTADRLARRGLPHGEKCILCDQVLEDLHHLLAACPFSRQVWHDVLS